MKRSSARRGIDFALGLALAALLLWVFFRETSWAELWRGIAGASLPLLGATVALNLLCQLLRAKRWQIMLRPLAPTIGLGPPWRYLNIGLAASSLLPGRPGEVLRPYLLARHQGVSFTSTLAIILTERMIDLGVVLAMLGTGFLIPTVIGPAQALSAHSGVLTTLRGAGLLALILLGALTLALVLLRLAPERARTMLRWAGRPLPERVTARVLPLAEAFIAGATGLQSGWQWLKVALMTALTWLVLLIGYGLTLWAFDLVVPPQRLPFFVAVIALGVVVPTPGGTGTYHAAIIVVAGELWGFNDGHAGQVAACALVSHALSLIPIVLLGVLYLGKEGLSALGASETVRADVR